jgi:catechol 2,3-dioxygenase-like lactoylglutathione lyase family enzyme
MDNDAGPVAELRLALTVPDLDAALAFWRDTLGLPELAVFEQSGGRVHLLGAGRATLELLDEGQAAFVDGIEVGRRVAPPVRVALEVADSTATAHRLVEAGATVLGGPVVTPWNDVNVRLDDAPGGVQLTLFTLGEGKD